MVQKMKKQQIKSPFSNKHLVDPNDKQSLLFFSYKSALVFFGFALLINAFFHPLLVSIGIPPKVSLFILNGAGLSGVLTLIILVIEKRMTDNKLKLFLIIFFIFIIFSYLIIRPF